MPLAQYIRALVAIDFIVVGFAGKSIPGLPGWTDSAAYRTHNSLLIGLKLQRSRSGLQRLLSFAKGRYAEVNFRLLDRRTRVVDIGQSSATCRRSRPAASGQINIATEILDAPAV
jgi:hypothetical protein